ncbi:MAG TPA: hypothetical protein VGK27_14020 [Candidatus Deferrimicrobiaceae bacterium]|jgi:hypothetical protein
MAKLPEELVNLLRDIESIKVVATLDGEGAPHAVVKGSLTTLDGETIAFNEGLETNISNKNLVRSIWFDRKVAINVTKGPVSYQIKGKPYRYLITGSIFKQFLLKARERRGPTADIAGVWIVTPEEVRNESPGFRRKQAEEERGQFHSHLDLLRAE